ncbi:hypothetical protein HMI56_002242 [Coelomomyces lativittatus]|nr:hypothetical protein HMI56_002242 [Coelomomyces lativittatus]
MDLRYVRSLVGGVHREISSSEDETSEVWRTRARQVGYWCMYVKQKGQRKAQTLKVESYGIHELVQLLLHRTLHG